jgi:hypothetical protein
MKEVRPFTRVPALRRRPVREVLDRIPQKYLDVLEQNQKIASCCRHPEEHEIEAFKSRAEETTPDIYIFHCMRCGRQHRRFCVGGSDARPFWDD